ncbi:hypothetical protein LOKG_00061 [Loktanella phage pCB2051-A]|uniref:Uncharacterized protein n=1 Tax=Loktanella phage pCB2051-A TaxID=754044 RepID=M4R1B3_9CAUD|nr:hypothetical protein LOKG_00061 [Loktanella phage pCB2051-A]AGH31497.1 hypothetical protein LOKG_00061 [Loktanella phage pCB2051-A]
MASSTTTVYAVVKVTIEIPVRASSPNETLLELQRVAVKEAEGILRNRLPEEFRIADTPQFSHATVRTSN